MNKPQEILNQPQSALKAELRETYQIDASEILFYNNDTEPFLGHEAACVMLNTLINPLGIEPEIIESRFNDALTMKTTITFADGKFRSGIGVVNVNEKIGDEVMSEQQRQQVASSRSMRSALLSAGIDLIRLHRESRTTGNQEFSGPLRSANFPRLLAQAHALGEEAGLITRTVEGGKETKAWHAMLWRRYQVNHSNQLSEELLTDFVAALRVIVPAQQAA
jgi:hypothetical protein